MVYTRLGHIQFGKGDVNISVSVSGTVDKPQAMLVFQNLDTPTEIGKFEANINYSRKKYIEYYPRKDFAMYFSNPESIDSLISALQVAKHFVFADGSAIEQYLRKDTEETR